LLDEAEAGHKEAMKAVQVACQGEKEEALARTGKESVYTNTDITILSPTLLLIDFLSPSPSPSPPPGDAAGEAAGNQDLISLVPGVIASGVCGKLSLNL